MSASDPLDRQTDGNSDVAPGGGKEIAPVILHPFQKQARKEVRLSCLACRRSLTPSCLCRILKTLMKDKAFLLGAGAKVELDPEQFKYDWRDKIKKPRELKVGL